MFWLAPAFVEWTFSVLSTFWYQLARKKRDSPVHHVTQTTQSFACTRQGRYASRRAQFDQASRATSSATTSALRSLSARSALLHVLMDLLSSRW